MANLSRKSEWDPVGTQPAQPFERARPTPWSLFLKEFDKLEFDKDYHTSFTHAVTRWAADLLSSALRAQSRHRADLGL